MTVSPTTRLAGPDEFRGVMGALAAGVAVVTTRDSQGEPRGLTTTAVTSVSLDPPLLLVCVGRSSRTLPALRHHGRFTVNLIGSAHSELAQRFASSAEDKFDAVPWRAGENDCPVLHDHSLAWAECTTELAVDAGDHVIFVGRVEAAETSVAEGLPLTYFRGRFGHWSSGGLRPATGAAAAAPAPADANPGSRPIQIDLKGEALTT